MYRPQMQEREGQAWSKTGGRGRGKREGSGTDALDANHVFKISVSQL